MLKAIRFVTAGAVLPLVITAMQSGVCTAENASSHSASRREADPDLRSRRSLSLPYEPRTVTIVQRGE
jgi:hypothetical protein